jgi:hypothetical protein
VTSNAALPMKLVLIDVVGTLLASIGLAGLLTDLSGVHPWLGNRDNAGMIAGAGFALMTFAILKIIGIVRARRAARLPHPPG